MRREENTEMEEEDMREGPAMQEMELSRPKARRLFLDFLFLIPHESIFLFHCDNACYTV